MSPFTTNHGTEPAARKETVNTALRMAGQFDEPAIDAALDALTRIELDDRGAAWR